jgi:hypothetical protein
VVLGPGSVGALVQAQQAARPSDKEAPSRVQVLAGRTGTDLAAASTEPWAPGGTARPRRWAAAVAGVLLLSASVLTVAFALKARHPAGRGAEIETQGGAEEPRPEGKRAELQKPEIRPGDSETSKTTGLSPPIPSEPSAARLLPVNHPATAAPTIPAQSGKRAALDRRRSKPRPTARARKGRAGETVRVWDPDSATLP